MSSITASSQITKSSNYNNNSLDQYERLLKENQENKKKILNLNEKINELTLINQNQKINFDKINNNLTQKYSKELKELKFKVESNDIEKFKIESNYKIKFNDLEKQKKMLELKNKNLTNKINEITLNEKNLENEIKLTFDERAKNQNVGVIYRCMIIAMIVGRIVWGVVKWGLLGAAGDAFTINAFIAGGFLNAIPGIIIQLILIPAIMVALDRAKLVPFKKTAN